jgi:Effector-associated domain 7
MDRFNDSELRTLCFNLGVDYDVLQGSGKSDKARELIIYLDRRNGISGY